MQTEVFKIDTPAHFSEAVRKATDLLRRGEIVALPTETVYGLAGNALDPDAVRRIYAAKGRPAKNPIIVHIDSLEMARDCSRSWSTEAAALAAAFWPGPLTLVVVKAASIPDIVTAGGDTVGIRWPAHPLMREVIRHCRFPLAAPSANPSNEISPTTGDHVLRTLDSRIPLVIDAGPSSVGIESTVVDLSVSPPRVLRTGMISRNQIAKVLGADLGESADAHAIPGSLLKSPGLLEKHYAPRAKLLIARWQTDSELKAIVEKVNVPFADVNIIAHDRIPQANPFGRVAIIPHDPEAYARAFYAELHRCDELGAGLILVEALPSGDEWQGIQDRLDRASAEN